jgi:hypothetical protein
MPVIRGEPFESAISDTHRNAVVEQLIREVSGEVTQNGPVVFEIPLHHSGKMDVLVVWDAWKPFDSEDRSDMILQAYAADQDKIALALGVTYEEAIEQQVLPYAVIPMARRGEADEVELNRLMIAEGAFRLPSGKADLRFPTMALAERAHRRLSDRLPSGYWSMVQNAASIG